MKWHNCFAWDFSDGQPTLAHVLSQVSHNNLVLFMYRLGLGHDVRVWRLLRETTKNRVLSDFVVGEYYRRERGFVGILT